MENRRPSNRWCSNSNADPHRLPKGAFGLAQHRQQTFDQTHLKFLNQLHPIVESDITIPAILVHYRFDIPIRVNPRILQ